MSPNERSGAPAGMQGTFIEAGNEKPREIVDASQFMSHASTPPTCAATHASASVSCFVYSWKVCGITRHCPIERVVA